MKQLKTGIVGCGKVARLHAKALAQSEYSLFTGVCSRDQSKADAFAADFGVRGYDDVTQMVEDAGLEAVVVCTPHPFHAEPTLQAAQAARHRSR